MKFVKENVTLIICAAVALLFVGLLFYPLGPMISTFQDSMRSRYSQHDTMEKYTKMKLEIPGADPWVGVPPDQLIKFKRDLIDSVGQGASKVDVAAADLNAQGRVANGVPLMDGKELKGFLPKLEGEALDYKTRYGAEWRALTALLVGKADTPGVPPDPTVVHADFDARMKARTDSMPPGMLNNPAIGMAGQQDPKELLDYEKKQVEARAAAIQMYVDGSPNGGSFQIRPWFLTDDPPNEQQIYESLVDVWLQGDVARAIAKVNKDALDKVTSATDRNVGRAPIKRLIHIMVGNNALTHRITAGQSGIGMGMAGTEDPGAQFLTPGSAMPTNTTGAAPTSFDMDMTGRVSGPNYDVVLMSIHMDIDPAYLQRFIDQLYRQNVGYTVLNWQEHTVDPLDRVSNGYIYGETQTEEVDILVESLLLRSWTVPLMPAAVRAALTVPATPNAPGAPAVPPVPTGGRMMN